MHRIRFLANEYYRAGESIIASHDIGKLIGLLHHAIFHLWRDPIIVSSLSATSWVDLDFVTGGKRLLATALVRPDPSDYLPALLFCRHGEDPSSFLAEFRPIIGDQDLQDLFRNAIESGDQVELIMQPHESRLRLWLGQSILPWQESDVIEEMRPWLRWIDRFRPPTISIHHDVDVELNDAVGFWQQTNDIARADYHLEIYRPMRFHLEDLLLWMDLAHGTFEDIHGRFLLRRTDGCSGHKYISVRH